MNNQIVDRLAHYIEEEFGKDEGKISKLKHDIRCGIEDALEDKQKQLNTYEKTYNRKIQKVHWYNEIKLKTRLDFQDENCPHIDRILKWYSDIEEGMIIRKNHGYRESGDSNQDGIAKCEVN